MSCFRRPGFGPCRWNGAVYPRLVEALGGLIVADGVGDCIQLREGGAGLEVLAGLGQGFELVVGRHHILVAFADAVLGVNFLGGKEAEPMEVEIRREHALGKVVDLGGEAARDVGIAQVLAHDGAILGLHQGVVVGSSGAGLGELGNAQFLQQGGDTAVDVLQPLSA